MYFDKLEGDPAGIIELKDLDANATWHTLHADITPTCGQHHVYLQFSLSTSRTKAFSVDQFSFSTETTDGVEDLATKLESDATPSYYDLSGRRLQMPPLHGTFIVRQGQRARVVIK